MKIKSMMINYYTIYLRLCSTSLELCRRDDYQNQQGSDMLCFL